jgi:cyclic pyranopterin monophosphate synthase
MHDKNNFQGASSEYQMINVAKKRPTHRHAIAYGSIHVGENAFRLIQEKSMPKGCPLLLCEIAGINAAKNVCSQLSLCHPIELEQVLIQTELDKDNFSVTVYATVCATAKTGVEMEALAGVNAALLSIYDITKNVEPALSIKEVRLLVKEGGKKGQWLHPQGVPQKVLDHIKLQDKAPLQNFKTSIITVSDRASQGVYEDKSGVMLKDKLSSLGASIESYGIVEDNKQSIIQYIDEITASFLPHLIVLTGGTGIASRDVTPEVIAAISEKEIPGIGELLRSTGAFYTPYSYLSRSVACLYQNALVISIPGNPKAIEQCLPPLVELIPHALGIVAKD